MSDENQITNPDQGVQDDGVFNPNYEEEDLAFLGKAEELTATAKAAIKELTERTFNTRSPLTTKLVASVSPMLRGVMNTIWALDAMGQAFGDMRRDYTLLAKITSKEDMDEYIKLRNEREKKAREEGGAGGQGV